MVDLLQEFYVEPVSWQFDAEILRAVRTEVFIVEQQVPEDEEWDNEDATAQHFLARANDGAAIGTARLSRAGIIGRMAVLASWRGRSVGDALLRTALEFAQGRALTEVRLMAQAHALAFYARHGFEPFGEVFDDVGIPHQWMKKALAGVQRPEPMARRAPADHDGAKCHTDFATRQEFSTHLLQLIDSTRHELAVFTHLLEPRVLDTRPLLGALRSLCSGGNPARLRIVLVNSRPAVNSAHPLIDLAQRLPSIVQIRKPGKDHLDHPAAFVIGDEHHLLFRPFGDQYRGYHQRNHRREARRQMHFFDEVYEHAEPDPNFRRLAL